MRLLLLFCFVFASFVCTQDAFSQQCGSPERDGNALLLSAPNTYYPGTASVTAGSNSITLGAALGTTPIAVGDLVLIIQMQGADIAPLNDDRYGDGVVGGFGNGNLATNFIAGQLEYAITTSGVPLSGGTLTVAAGLANGYENADFIPALPPPPANSQGQRRFQVIRVPQNKNIILGANIQPPAWNGSVGGVLALQAKQTFTFNGFNLDASGRGFRGGAGRMLNGGVNGSPGGPTDFLQLSTYDNHGSKGEGLAGTPHFLNNNEVLLDNLVEGYLAGSACRGAPGNAGGGATDADVGGNSENSGGGGGGNGGSGGKGGNAWFSAAPVGGEPGGAFSAVTPKRLVMGGGGGAGSNDGGTGTPAGGIASSGAAGGGIIIVYATTYSDPGTINVNGAAANDTPVTDGSGGGGAGGSALILGALGVNNVSVTANGGKGGNNLADAPDPHGPGGGGGGGVIYSVGPLGAISILGGVAGTTGDALTNFGATGGGTGIQDQTFSVFFNIPTFYISCAIVLPVKLLEFTASPQHHAVLLKWSTSTEENSDFFHVEKSLDGINWEMLTRVDAAVNSNTLRNYQALDNFPVNGKNYYRLKMVDKNGEIAYSPIQIVNFNGKDFGIRIAPNPNNGRFGIYLYKPLSPSAVLKIVSAGGQIMIQRKVGNLQAITIEDTRLAKGIYVAVIASDEGIMSKKFVVK